MNKTLQNFIDIWCSKCGSQRCDPPDENWRKGCPKWREQCKKNGEEFDGKYNL